MKLTQYLTKTLEYKQHYNDNNSSDDNLELFRGKPFVCSYNTLEPTEDNCCFNHIIGLPISANNVLPSPIWQWQYDYIIKHLETKKYNWILKATGIGLSKIVLRWILYKSVVNDKWSNGIVPIFTGVNYDLARRLIDRAASMLYRFFPNRKQTERTIIVNNVEITAFPGGHMDTARSLTNTRMFFLDEFDFFEEHKNIESGRKIAERQIAKSNPDILIASTPNRPGGPMQQIHNEEPSLYNKIFLPYTIGIGTIYTAEQIVQNMKSPSFPQEYDLKYMGGIGNVFHYEDIDFITNDKYNPAEYNPIASHFMGIDVGFGPSDTAIVVTRYQNNKIEVIHTETISKGLYEDIITKIVELIERYRIGKVYVDGSAVSLIRSLKVKYKEYTRWDLLDEKVLQSYIYSDPNEPKIVPIGFAKYHREMLKKLMLCISKHAIRIDKRFDKLITGLRSATAKDDNYSLNKEHTAYPDLIDALRLSIIIARFKGE